MQTPAPDPRTADSSERWLFGPAPDLVFGCGLGYAWIFLALAVLDVRFVEAIPLGFLPLVLMITATPHYGATLLRVYEQRESRRAYALFSVGATAILAASFLVSLHVLAFGSLLMTIYFNWNPWHYGGQNYGLAVMFLRRRGVEITPMAKRLLWGSFVLSALLAIVEMNGLSPGAIYAPVGDQTTAKAIGPFYRFVSIGIAPAIQQNLTSVGLAAYFACLLGAAGLLLRGCSLRDIGPSAALVATQSLWFVIPAASRIWGVFDDWVPLGAPHFNYAFMWIAVGHSVQYLWVTTYYAQKTERFSGFRRYYVKCLLAGSMVWSFPALLFAPNVLGTIGYNDGLFLLIASVANLHHFVLDGAIWKLRDSRIAAVLIRKAQPAAEPGPADEVGTRWFRPIVWVLGSVCVVTFVIGTWEREVGFRQAVRRADYARVEQAGRRLTWIGQQDAALYRYLAALSNARGHPEDAIREYRRSLEVRQHPSAWFELGSIHAKRDDWPAARDAFEAAYRIDPFPVALIVQYSRALLETGEVERARQVLQDGIALHPGQPKLLEQLREADAAGGRAQARPERDPLPTGYSGTPITRFARG